MAYRVEFLKTADEELAELPKDTQRQIVKKIEGLKGNPRPAGVQRLQSPESGAAVSPLAARKARIRVADLLP